METLLNGFVTLHQGDCLDVLPTLADASVDSAVTDPPYGIEFMGRHWDHGAPGIEYWKMVFRILKPGGYLLAFGGTRTFHRLAVAIEDAGFEIRDCLMYLYGSGFPKSHNIGNGLGTALKPACEPIIMARRPLIGTVAANVLEHGTGAINIDACRIATTDGLGGGDQLAKTKVKAEGWDRPWMQNAEAKAAHSERVNANVIKAEALGRWPANVLHDGSDEVVAAFPELGKSTGGRIGNAKGAYSALGDTGFTTDHVKGDPGFGDSGSAARFFYTAKADSDDRLGSKHPTVKPLDLMQWLVRLVTPKGGLVLDLFAGTGTTGEAAWREGMRSVLIEREDEYCDDVRRRMKLALSSPDTRGRESAKARNKDKPVDHGPLFGGT